MRLIYIVLVLVVTVFSVQGDESSKKRIFAVRKTRVTKSEENVSKEATSSSLPTSTKLTTTKKSTQQLNKKLTDKNSQVYTKLRSRLGNLKITSMTTTPQPPENNSSHLLIPIPSSQQKPYQPVVVQLTNNNVSTATEKNSGEKKLVTYKLNKLFMPLGIYGKVIENDTTVSTETLKKEARRHRPADDISITYESLNDKIDITEAPRRKIVSRVDLTTDHTKSIMPPPEPFVDMTTENINIVPSNMIKTTIQKTKNAFNKLPGIQDILEKGLSTLGRIEQGVWRVNPFVDSNGGGSGAGGNLDSLTGGSDHIYKTTNLRQGSVIAASVPGGVLPDVTMTNNGGSSSSGLEYFRNRPHLHKRRNLRRLQQQQQNHQANGHQNLIDFLFPPNHAHLTTAFFPDKKNELTQSEIQNLSFFWKQLSKKYSQKRLIAAREIVSRIFEGQIDADDVKGVNSRRIVEDLLNVYKRVFEVVNNGNVVKDTAAVVESVSTESLGSWTPVGGIHGNYEKNIPKKHHGNNIKKQVAMRPVVAKKPSGIVDKGDYELIPRDEYLKNKEKYGELLKTVVKTTDGRILEVQNGDHKPTKQKQSTLLLKNKEQADLYKQKEDSFVLPDKYYKETMGTLLTRRNDYYNNEESDDGAVVLDSFLLENPQQKQSSHQLQSSSIIDTDVIADLISQSENNDDNDAQQPATSLSTAYNYHNAIYNSMFSTTTPRPTQKPTPITKFFAPIPLTQPLISETLKGRYYSPKVPRYVAELANKLKRDRDVQGIVRVVSINKRDRNKKPVEFLYPVRG